MEEVWKDIPWYEGIYQVSSIGMVKSLDRRLPVQRHFCNYKWMILSTHLNKDWYILVALSRIWIQKIFLVHRLVALAFIPNPENKPEINHIDGNKYNNDLSNLEWCTHKENINHAIRTGLMTNNHSRTNHPMKGRLWKDNPKSKPVTQYSLLWEFVRDWDSTADIIRELWASRWSVERVCKWKGKTAIWFIWKYKNIEKLWIK